jgi:hypothetical protein
VSVYFHGNEEILLLQNHEDLDTIVERCPEIIPSPILQTLNPVYNDN